MEHARDGVKLTISFDSGVTILRVSGVVGPGARTDAMRALAVPSAGTKMAIVFDECEYIARSSVDALLGGDNNPLLVCRAGGVLSRILPAEKYYHSLAKAMATLGP